MSPSQSTQERSSKPSPGSIARHLPPVPPQLPLQKPPLLQKPPQKPPKFPPFPVSTQKTAFHGSAETRNFISSSFVNLPNSKAPLFDRSETRSAGTTCPSPNASPIP